jgi:hypothetical protein
MLNHSTNRQSQESCDGVVFDTPLQLFSLRAIDWREWLFAEVVNARDVRGLANALRLSRVFGSYSVIASRETL